MHAGEVLNTILSEIKDNIARIILNRPDKRNALNAEMVSELTAEFIKLEQLSSIKVVTLTGAGKVFSAGADLDSIQKLTTNSYEENLDDSNKLKTLFKLIYNFPKPVIAIVNGHAIAGGCGLATVCDITIVKSSAKLGYTEVKIGFVAALVMVFLKDLVGEKRAKDLLFSGRLISASYAENIGLITRSISEESFEEDVKSSIAEYASNSPSALEITKNLFHKIKEQSFDDGLSLASETNAKTRETSDCREGISAFLEKRSPVWSKS